MVNCAAENKRATVGAVNAAGSPNHIAQRRCNVADAQSYQTRAEMLRAAQIKLDQAALFLHIAGDAARAATTIQTAREVRAIRQAEK